MKLLKHIIPLFFEKKMISYASHKIREKLIREDSQINKYELEHKHFANLKAIGNRMDLLEVLPNYGIAAEIGVNIGVYSKKILSINKPKKLHLVDNWGSEQYPRSLKNKVEKKFATEILAGNVEINKGLSIEMALTFDNNYFDWIYIDTDHSYQVTIQELESYRLKMKPNGIIAGHDYILGNWNGMVRYGVKEAVYEFCIKYNWEIIYLTMENKEHPSFAIKKITDN